MRIAGYEQRKNQLIGRLGALTGQKAVYNGAPDFSYDIGDYRVLRDGSVVVLDEYLDPDILEKLVSENLVIDPDLNSDVKAPEKEQPEEPAVEIPETVQKETHKKGSPMASPAWNYGSVSDSHIYDNPIVIKERRVLVHTMVNLLNMFYSKGELLSAVVGKSKAFWVSEYVMAEIPYQRPNCYQSLMNIIKNDNRVDLVKGIEFKQNAVIFTGFPTTDDYLKRKAYEKLAECMYEHASEVRWTIPRRMDIPNEKYTARTFFNQIGLGGAENRTIREILMKNLSGNGTYRTRAQLVAERTRRQEASEKRKREKAMNLLNNVDM